MGQGGGEGDGLYTIPADSIGLKSLLYGFICGVRRVWWAREVSG